jgi:RNA polymerase-binding transcription factor DksA
MATAFIETSACVASLEPATVDRLRHALVAERAVQAEAAYESDAAGLAELGADDIAGRDLAMASLARARVMLEEIDAALARIDDGTYGRCERCREPIPNERLDAVPHARCCVRCAAGER